MDWTFQIIMTMLVLNTHLEEVWSWVKETGMCCDIFN